MDAAMNLRLLANHPERVSRCTFVRHGAGYDCAVASRHTVTTEDRA